MVTGRDNNNKTIINDYMMDSYQKAIYERAKLKGRMRTGYILEVNAQKLRIQLYPKPPSKQM